MIVSINGKTQLWYCPKNDFLVISAKTCSGHYLYQVGETVLDVFSSTHSPQSLLTNAILIDREFNREAIDQ